MGSQTVPFCPGRRTAYSTRLALPGMVATFSAYWPGARISRRMPPSCTSPRMPRVLTPDSTRLSPPTSAASVCISPRPLYTCSSCWLTARKESEMRFCSVVCSFSSTVPRISSSLRLLSVRMVSSPCARAARRPSMRAALESSRPLRRRSSSASCAVTASLAAFWRAAPVRSMASSRAPAAAALWFCVSASSAPKSRTAACTARTVSPWAARCWAASARARASGSGAARRLCSSKTASSTSPSTARASSTIKSGIITTGSPLVCSPAVYHRKRALYNRAGGPQRAGGLFLGLLFYRISAVSVFVRSLRSDPARRSRQSRAR